MHPFWKYLVVILCAVGALALTGCGGGGGASGPIDPGPTPGTSETFTVVAGQAVDETIGDISVNVPANTFSQDARVTVELHPISTRPMNRAVGVIGNEVTITSTVAPSGQITIVQNGNSSSRSTTPYYLPISLIGGKWRKIGEATESLGRIQSSIDPKWFAISGSLRVLLCAVNSSLDFSVGLTCLAGDSSNQTDNVAFLIHGILSDENAMRPLGQALFAKGHYKSVWALRYDWRLPTEYVASKLGDYFVNCLNADFYSHSRGVLICRYTLEILQKRPQTLVNWAILICGPNTGSKLDPGVEFLTSLQEYFLNDENAVGFPIVGTPAVQELTAGSDVVRALNTHGCNSSLGTKYFLFAAESDVAVDCDSALARGINVECFTGFSAVRQTLAGDHSTLISDPGGIQNMLSFVPL